MKVKHKHLITSIKNPRTFVISGNTGKIKPIIILGEIISLVTDTFSIDIGQIFPVKQRNYKVNSIQSKVVGSTITYEVSSAALNKSSLFVFRIPKDPIQNFKKFKEGKYSELDITYKTKILEFHNFNLQGDLAQILFKSENRRLRLEEQLNVKLPVAAELHSIINLEEEIFNPYVYINKKRD